MKGKTWMLPVLLALVPLACGSGVQALGGEAFSFEYRRQAGLDCGMAGNCGYLVQVSEKGEMVRYDLPGTGAPVQAARGVLLPDERTTLFRMLSDGGFFDLPDVVPEADPVAGGGSIWMHYSDPATGTTKAVRVMLGRPLPAPVLALIEQIQAFLLERVG